MSLVPALLFLVLSAALSSTLGVLHSREPALPCRPFTPITDGIVPSRSHQVPTSPHTNTGPRSPGLPPCFPTSLCQAGSSTQNVPSPAPPAEILPAQRAPLLPTLPGLDPQQEILCHPQLTCTPAHVCVCTHAHALTHTQWEQRFPKHRSSLPRLRSLIRAVLFLLCKSNAARGQLNGFCDSL